MKFSAVCNVRESVFEWKFWKVRNVEKISVPCTIEITPLKTKLHTNMGGENIAELRCYSEDSESDMDCVVFTGRVTRRVHK